MEAYKLCPRCKKAVPFSTYFGGYFCDTEKCDWKDDSYNIKRAKGLLDMENITCSICDSKLKINEKGSVAPCIKCMAELKLESIDFKDVLVVTSDVLTVDETDELKVEFGKAVEKMDKDTYLVVANYDIKLQNLTDKEVEDAGLKRMDK